MDSGFTNRSDDIAMERENNFYREKSLRELVEENSNSLQQLKAEIALCHNNLVCSINSGDLKKVNSVLNRLQQLSAV